MRPLNELIALMPDAMQDQMDGLSMCVRETINELNAELGESPEAIRGAVMMAIAVIAVLGLATDDLVKGNRDRAAVFSVSTQIMCEEYTRQPHVNRILDLIESRSNTPQGKETQ